MEFGRYALDVIDRLRQRKGAAELSKEMAHVVTTFGFSCCFASGIPHPGRSFSDMVLLSHCPSEWLDRYFGCGYDLIDASVQRIRETSSPFRWRDLRREPGLTSAQSRIFDEVGEFDFRDAFVIPIHDRYGLEGAITFATSNYMISEREEAALRLIAIYAYEALREAPIIEDMPRLLTTRELDCVSWAAEGKTASEIAGVLHISKQTVEEYLGNAARKLGARSRTQLVAVCIRLGLIL